MDTQAASETGAGRPDHPVLYVFGFLSLGVIYLIAGLINIAAPFGWWAYGVGAVVLLVLCAVFARYRTWAMASATTGIGLGVGALFVSFGFWGY